MDATQFNRWGWALVQHIATAIGSLESALGCQLLMVMPIFSLPAWPNPPPYPHAGSAFLLLFLCYGVLGAGAPGSRSWGNAPRLWAAALSCCLLVARLTYHTLALLALVPCNACDNSGQAAAGGSPTAWSWWLQLLGLGCLNTPVDYLLVSGGTGLG